MDRSVTAKRSAISKRSVTSKVCAILDAVCAAPAGLSATALGRRVGMPLSTAHRLAGELVATRSLDAPRGRARNRSSPALPVDG